MVETSEAVALFILSKDNAQRKQFYFFVSGVIIGTDGVYEMSWRFLQDMDQIPSLQ